MKCRRPACKNKTGEGKVYCSGECRAEHKRRMEASAHALTRARLAKEERQKQEEENEREREQIRHYRLADAIFPTLSEWERDLMFEDLVEEIEERIRQ